MKDKHMMAFPPYVTSPWAVYIHQLRYHKFIQRVCLLSLEGKSNNMMVCKSSLILIRRVIELQKKSSKDIFLDKGYELDQRDTIQKTKQNKTMGAEGSWVFDNKISRNQSTYHLNAYH